MIRSRDGWVSNFVSATNYHGHANRRIRYLEQDRRLTKINKNMNSIVTGGNNEYYHELADGGIINCSIHTYNYT